MNIFLYTDESGILNPDTHNRFVIGGLLFAGKKARDDFSAKFRDAERSLGVSVKEPKWSKLDIDQRNRLLKAVTGDDTIRFAVTVNPKEIIHEVFEVKTGRTEYLEYLYTGVVCASVELVKDIDYDSVEFIYLNQDEHTAFTPAVRKELQETLLKACGRPSFSYDFTQYFPPEFPKLNGVSVQTWNSEKVPLVRAADIVAGAVYDNQDANLAVRVDL